jgi:hypothetical protein
MSKNDNNQPYQYLVREEKIWENIESLPIDEQFVFILNLLVSADVKHWATIDPAYYPQIPLGWISYLNWECTKFIGGHGFWIIMKPCEKHRKVSSRVWLQEIFDRNDIKALMKEREHLTIIFHHADSCPQSREDTDRILTEAERLANLQTTKGHAYVAACWPGEAL